VLAETALFVSAALLFMLGTIQIGVIGFLQLTSDSAAFFDARTNVLTAANGMTPEQNTHVLFPQIPVPDISPTVIPAPTPTIPVDYLYNDPNPAVRAQSAYNRHGGASMLQPAAEQVTVNVPGLVHILGQGLGVESVTSSESLWQECGTHFDIANVGCSLANPPANSQTNYFTQGENTPPYMVGFNYMQQCTLVAPWGIYTGGASPIGTSHYSNAVGGDIAVGGSLNNSNGAGWNIDSPCSTGSNNGNSSVSYIAMGSAEFLDTDNWGNGGSGSGANGSGISGPCDTAKVGSTGTEASDQSVFCAIWWHQRVYSDLAKYFTQYPYQYYPELYSQAYDYSVAAGQKLNPQNQFGNLATTYYSFGQLITLAGLGNGTDAGHVALPEKILTFEDFEGLDDSNYGPGYASGAVSPATPDRWNADVQTIYSWDIPVSAGDPPSDPTYNNPTNPLNGCC
jgi:hypothetical protein